MFTGIIQATASILRTKVEGTCLRVRIAKPRLWRLTTGESVAIDGICSTIVTHGKTFFDVVYMPETLKKTTASQFIEGEIVNLERSFTLTQPLDGNLVSGHVDACGQVVQVRAQGNARLVTLAFPRSLGHFIAPQGSIVINGTSLTVASVRGSDCTVALIPHTLLHTNLGQMKRGDSVNIEVDLVARYVVHALTHNLLTKRQYAKKG